MFNNLNYIYILLIYLFKKKKDIYELLYVLINGLILLLYYFYI